MALPQDGRFAVEAIPDWISPMDGPMSSPPIHTTGECSNWRPIIAVTPRSRMTIRDLKYGVGLNHMPSGRFAANGAWLAVQAMAHNLARWTARIGLGEQIVTTKTLRRLCLGRTPLGTPPHPALPQRWPWDIAPWPGCEPFHSQTDGALRH